jgi:hypothetical protein
MWQMQIHDLEGTISDASETDLLSRLRNVRKGKYGAFILEHDEVGPSLFVHINGELAYLHYFPDNSGQSAGCQSTGMTPPGCPETVLFVQTDGSEGSGSAIEVLDYNVCTVDVAYQAAGEFYREPRLPRCVEWEAI